MTDNQAYVRIGEFIESHPSETYSELAVQLGLTRSQVTRIARLRGIKRGPERGWQRLRRRSQQSRRPPRRPARCRRARRLLRLQRSPSPPHRVLRRRARPCRPRLTRHQRRLRSCKPASGAGGPRRVRSGGHQAGKGLSRLHPRPCPVTEEMMARNEQPREPEESAVALAVAAVEGHPPPQPFGYRYGHRHRPHNPRS